MLFSILTFLFGVQEGKSILPEGAASHFISGDYWNLVEMGGRLYAASGYGLAAMDTELKAVGHFPTLGYSRKVRSCDDGKLCLSDAESVALFDASGSNLGSYEIGSEVTALSCGQGFVAAGTESGLFAVIYLSSKNDAPASVNLGSKVESIVFWNGYFYAAAGGSIYVITCEKAPKIIKETSLPGVKTLAAGDSRLYAGLSESKIAVFSLKDPKEPKEESVFDAPASPVALCFQSKKLFAALGYQGYAVFDAKGKRLDASRGFAEGYVADILPSKKGFYLALRDKGIVFLEGKNFANMEITRRLPKNAPSVHTARGGEFWAIAQGRDGAKVVKPEPEKLVVGFADPKPDNAAGVLLSGTNLYVVDPGRSLLSIFSLKEFPVTKPDFTINQAGDLSRIALSNELILDAAGEKGLRVLWICPCGPLKEKGKLEGIKAVDVAVKDSIVYVADPDSGLWVVALRKEGETPVTLSLYPGTVSPRSLLVEQDRLYVADSIGALAVLDISNPKEPGQFSFTMLGSRPYGLALSGSTLYLACGEKGVLKVDVSDPHSPRILGYIDTPGKALSVAASEAYLGVADYTSWLLLPIDK